MTTPFQSRQFSVQLPESAVGPASIAGAKANQQTGKRNIVGYAGPVSGQGSDMTTLAEAANVANANAVTLATGMRNAECHWRHNNQDTNIGTVASTRLQLGAGTASNGVLNTQAAPPVGADQVNFGSVQLPASGTRTTYPNTGNQKTLNGVNAGIAAELPALGTSGGSEAADQLVGMVMGTTSEGIAGTAPANSFSSLLMSNFQRNKNGQHVRDGQIIVMKMVLDNGPANQFVTVPDPATDPTNVNGVAPLSGGDSGQQQSVAGDTCALVCAPLTGAVGAKTLNGANNQLRWAPQVYANSSGLSGPLDSSMGSTAQVTNAQTWPPASASYSVQGNAGNACFYNNAMEVILPRNGDDQPNNARECSVVFRYRRRNSDQRGPETNGAKYTPTNTPMYYDVTSPNVLVAENNRVSGTNYIAVSGEPINSAVGNQECIEIVAVIPAAVSFLNPPGVEGGIVRTNNYNLTDGGAGNILIGN